jgi:hypothetical protein
MLAFGKTIGLQLQHFLMLFDGEGRDDRMTVVRGMMVHKERA